MERTLLLVLLRNLASQALVIRKFVLLSFASYCPNLTRIHRFVIGLSTLSRILATAAVNNMAHR